MYSIPAQSLSLELRREFNAIPRCCQPAKYAINVSPKLENFPEKIDNLVGAASSGKHILAYNKDT